MVQGSSHSSVAGMTATAVFLPPLMYRSLKRVTARDEHSFFHEHGIRA